MLVGPFIKAMARFANLGSFRFALVLKFVYAFAFRWGWTCLVRGTEHALECASALMEEVTARFGKGTLELL